MSLQHPSVSAKWVKVPLVDLLNSSSYSHTPHTPLLHPPTLHTPSPVTSFHCWATSMLSGLTQHYRKLDVTIYVTMCPPLPSSVLTDCVLSEEGLGLLQHAMTWYMEPVQSPVCLFFTPSDLQHLGIDHSLCSPLPPFFLSGLHQLRWSVFFFFPSAQKQDCTIVLGARPPGFRSWLRGFQSDTMGQSVTLQLCALLSPCGKRSERKFSSMSSNSS